MLFFVLINLLLWSCSVESMEVEASCASKIKAIPIYNLGGDFLSEWHAIRTEITVDRRLSSSAYVYSELRCLLRQACGQYLDTWIVLNIVQRLPRFLNLSVEHIKHKYQALDTIIFEIDSMIKHIEFNIEHNIKPISFDIESALGVDSDSDPEDIT